MNKKEYKDKVLLWKLTEQQYDRGYNRSRTLKSKVTDVELLKFLSFFGKRVRVLKNSHYYKYPYKQFKDYELNLLVGSKLIYLEIIFQNKSIIVQSVNVKNDYIFMIDKIYNHNWDYLFDKHLISIEKGRKNLLSFEKILSLYSLAKKDLSKRLFKITPLTKLNLFFTITIKTNYSKLCISKYYSLFF